MKNHCKAIAMIGVILILCVTGIRIYELKDVLDVNYNNTKLALIWLIEGGTAAYVIYVMWSAFAEMLNRIEETYFKVIRSFSGLERIEKEIRELTKSVHEKIPSTGEISKNLRLKSVVSETNNINCESDKNHENIQKKAS